MKSKYKINAIYCLSLTEKLLATLPAKLLGYSVFWMEHLRIERWLIQNPYRLFYVLLSRLANTITVSNAVKKQLLNLGLSKDKVKVIYNGVDLKKFKTQSPKPKTQSIIIGTVCRLCPEKGIDDLIHAFKKIKDQGYNVELRIVGKGPEKEKLKNLVLTLGIADQVKFLGFQKNLPKILSTFDIFVLTPYRRESFGIAAAEAQACQIPVVATNISGLSEVVQNGRTGFIVSPKDIKAIARAIEKLIKNPDLAEKMGKEGRKRVEKYFGLKRMLLEFKQIFRTTYGINSYN